MSVKVSGPDRDPPTGLPTWTVVMSGWCSRLTSLYGVETRTTSATPGIACRLSAWNCVDVADQADDGAAHAAADERRAAGGLDPRDDRVDLFVRRPGAMITTIVPLLRPAR